MIGNQQLEPRQEDLRYESVDQWIKKAKNLEGIIEIHLPNKIENAVDIQNEEMQRVSQVLPLRKSKRLVNSQKDIRQEMYEVHPHSKIESVVNNQNNDIVESIKSPSVSKKRRFVYIQNNKGVQRNTKEESTKMTTNYISNQKERSYDFFIV